MSAPPHVELTGVRVEYPRGVRGLVGVDLRIEPGEFLYLVGASGAGKSTLLRLLTGETRANAGVVRVEGRDVSEYRAWNLHRLRRRIGIVPQDGALLPRKRVWENMTYAMRAVGATRAETWRRVPEMLDAVGMTTRADAFPVELSAGEIQRVALARALVNRPPLIVADEPTGNLDPDNSREVVAILRRLAVRGTTILVATHDETILRENPARTVRLAEGRIVEDAA